MQRSVYSRSVQRSLNTDTLPYKTRHFQPPVISVLSTNVQSIFEPLLRYSSNNPVIRNENGNVIVGVKGAGDYELETRNEEHLAVLRPAWLRREQMGEIDSIWIDDETVLFNGFIHEFRKNFTSQNTPSICENAFVHVPSAETTQMVVEKVVQPNVEPSLTAAEGPTIKEQPVKPEILKKFPKCVEGLLNKKKIPQTIRDLESKFKIVKPLQNPLDSSKGTLFPPSSLEQCFEALETQAVVQDHQLSPPTTEPIVNKSATRIRLVKANQSDIFNRVSSMKNICPEFSFSPNFRTTNHLTDFENPFSVMFNRRQVFQYYLTENDARLICFCCSFNNIIPSDFKTNFLTKVNAHIDSEWGRLINFKICNLQPKIIKKNEQFEKKVFKFIFRNLSSEYRTKILNLSDLRPRTQLSKTENKEDTSKRNKKIKKLNPTESQFSTDSLNKHKKVKQVKNTQKEVAYNSRTYRNIGNDPELKVIFIDELEKLKKEVLQRLFNDLLGEIGSAIRYFDLNKPSFANLNTSDIEKLKINALQQYYQIWERQRQWSMRNDMLRLQQQSNQNKSRTLKLPWTYSTLHHAISKFESLITFRDTTFDSEPVPRRLSEAIDCAKRQKLIDMQQETILRSIIA